MSGTPQDVRIAVIDDHPVARYGLRMIFADAPGLTVVHDASSLTNEALNGHSVDVIVLDLYLPDGKLSGAEIAAAARQCPVVIVSASARRDDVLTAIRAGASGYLTKDSSDESYLAAVHGAIRGEFYISPQVADVLDAEQDCLHPANPRNALSPRERQALTYIAQGFTQGQAARRMGISPATIDTYMKRIRGKLGAGNKADLTRRALALSELDDGRIALPDPFYD